MIIDLDYISEYPRIIQTINASPETKVAKVLYWEDTLMDWYNFNKGKEDCNKNITIYNFSEYKEINFVKLKKWLLKNDYVIACNGVVYDNSVSGILPTIIDGWFNERVEFKNQLKKYKAKKDELMEILYECKQYADKILLNTGYGVLGLPVFRFYDKDMAESVTTTGRWFIKYGAKRANQFLQKYGKKDYVLYIHTDSIFLHLENMNDLDMVKKVCKEVQDYTNESLLDFCKNILMVNTNKYMSLKQEIIARTALFLAKNRNALWVINEEGVDVDKIVVKGINTVSTSFPQAFKDILGEILEDILKLKSKDSIDAKLIKFNNNLTKQTLEDIGIVKSVNGIDKYFDPIIKYKKGAPVQVKSAINYNILLKELKLMSKYKKIKSGEKIKYVYVKENPYGFDSIAYTDESDKKILDWVQKYIDYKKVFKAELYNKLKMFYDAVGWELPEEILVKKILKRKVKKNAK